MPGEDAEDADLMSAVARGELQAAERLFRAHGAAVLRLSQMLTRDDSAAEEACQDTFLAALARAGTYRAEAGAVRPWLFAIARNMVRREHRRTVRLIDADPSVLDLGRAAGWGQEDPERKLSQRQERGLLSQALSTLSEQDREMVLLRDVEGLSGTETAQVLGLGLAAMKSRLHRARLRLMAAFREQAAGIEAKEQVVGGMRCSAVLAELSAYVDGELAADVRAQVDEHLRGCSVCERFGGRFSLVVHGVRNALGAEVAIDPELVGAMLARLTSGN